MEKEQLKFNLFYWESGEWAEKETYRGLNYLSVIKER